MWSEIMYSFMDRHGNIVLCIPRLPFGNTIAALTWNCVNRRLLMSFKSVAMVDSNPTSCLNILIFYHPLGSEHKMKASFGAATALEL